MLFFGHTGISLGIVELLSVAFQGSARPARGGTNKKRTPSTAAAGAHNPHPVPAGASSLRGIQSAVTQIDYRLVLLGSLLPDAIDKPLGMVVMADVFSNGRIFAHTLIFVAALVVAGSYLLLQHGKISGLTLAFASGLHLVFDEMWSQPATLLWPLYGWSFPRGDISNWLANMVHSVLTDPRDYIPEIVGAAILAQLLFRLSTRGELGLFVKTGNLGNSDEWSYW